MSLPKRVLFYGLLAALTLLAVEGMARLAYFLAFEPGELTPPYQVIPGRSEKHPFYGYIHGGRGHDYIYGYSHGREHYYNVMPPRQRREDLVLIGLFGGSVAKEIYPALQRALTRYFSANNLARRPVVLGMGVNSFKQPQQVIVAANTLLLGGDFDLIVNLDGYNEVSAGADNQRSYPFLPFRWHHLVNLTPAESRLAGRIAIARDQLRQLQHSAETHPFRYTAVYRIMNRYRLEQRAKRIIQLNHDLQAELAVHRLEKHGPSRPFRTEADLNREEARIWYRGSLLLSELAQLSGAEYYHFLQPNQYLPGAKPLTARELDCCYRAGTRLERVYREGYPFLVPLGENLTRRQVNYFDLTQIFQDNRETLYQDTCCHFNERGNELLAAAMVERLEPALLRVGNARPPVSGLDAVEPAEELLMDGPFRVYRRAGNWLVYVRENCAVTELQPQFFLHIIPTDAADLPPERREYGFDNLDFPFADAGRLVGSRCTAGRQLPAYSIAAIRTGQYVEGAGKVWEREHRFAE